MRVRAPAIAGFVGVMLAAGFAFADSVVGGPPTLDIQRCFRQIAPCSDPVVLGKEKHALGRVEVVGFHSRVGLCIDIDVIRVGRSGACPVAPLPFDGSAVSINGPSVDFATRPAVSQIVGALRPDVARIRVTYRRHGHVKRRRGGVIQVRGELLEAVKEEEPFGVTEAVLQGCLASKRVRVTAFDSQGGVLEVARTRKFRAVCRQGAAGS